MVDKLKCVVLNSTYEPLSIVTVRKALRLSREGKAMIHKYHQGQYVRSANESFQAPAAVVLKRYVNRRLTAAILTRKNLFERDRHTCQYCLRTPSDFRNGEFLTRDHVIPESKGGPLTWANLVTCCNSCNNKKGNKTLAESGMKLHSVPIVPSIVDVWARRFNLEY